LLEVYPKHGDCRISAAELAAEGLDHHSWIDLQHPTPEEVAEVERLLGLKVPTREALEEIEVSSRIRMEGEALAMSTPLLARGEDGTPVSAPTGFVLTRRMCLTVRFAASAVFDTVKSELQNVDSAAAADVFARLLEEVVDRAADHFEVSADQLDKASHAIFHLDQDRDGKRRQRLSKDTQLLRQVMTEIGRASERMSRVRYTLVCVSRMAQFATDRAKDWMDDPIRDRLASVRADIASLEQFEENLLSRVQLLQDAATAFISIEQNDVVKVLTIASVVGVPPVMVVGLYGMNFKYMPELGWRYGYPFALALIVITTLIPLAWFKWKDWM
jgi:magnesium transporter